MYYGYVSKERLHKMADLTNFKKLTDKQQYQSVIALIKSFPIDQQDVLAEECLGTSLEDAIRIMEEL